VMRADPKPDDPGVDLVHGLRPTPRERAM
jgi:hypothetical protein